MRANQVEHIRKLPETKRSLTIGADTYTVYDIETEWGIMRLLSKNGMVVGAMRRSSARELGLLLGGDQLLTVEEYTRVRTQENIEHDTE